MPELAVVRAGTRASRLALWQTEHVIARLAQAWPQLSFERVRIRTLGDRITNVPLPQIGDRGLFTRELEDGLRGRTIDFAVHSLKDLPTEQPEGLALGAVLSREDPERGARRAGTAVASPISRPARGSARRRCGAGRRSWRCGPISTSWTSAATCRRASRRCSAASTRRRCSRWRVCGGWS